MAKDRVRITLDVDDDTDLPEAIRTIAGQIEEDHESGTHDGVGDLDWDMRPLGHGVDIDRRQRIAAVALLMGFDLPQEMGAAALSMLEAAELCPGMTMGEMGPMGTQDRRQALEMAQRLIAEMLAEMPEAGR